MKRLYLAVAIPKTLYTVNVWICPIYTTSTEGVHTAGSKGAIRKLNSVQRIAMLSITGAMRTAPTDSLEILSNTWPIAHRIQNICQQATLRLAAVPLSHPLHPFVKNAANRFVKRHRSSLHHLFHAYSIHPDAIEPLTRSRPKPTTSPPYKIHIAPNPETAIEEISKLDHEHHTTIYSDGSGTDKGIGAAAIYLLHPTHRQKYFVITWVNQRITPYMKQRQ